MLARIEEIDGAVADVRTLSTYFAHNCHIDVPSHAHLNLGRMAISKHSCIVQYCICHATCCNMLFPMQFVKLSNNIG